MKQISSWTSLARVITREHILQQVFTSRRTIVATLTCITVLLRNLEYYAGVLFLVRDNAPVIGAKALTTSASDYQPPRADA